MEKLVRPFQTRDIGPPKPIKTATDEESEPEQVQIGRGGSPKIMFGNERIDITYYAVKKMREKKRV